MIYLLDTNVCIHLLNERHPAVLKHFRKHIPVDIALCSVVKAELLYGARRSQRSEANLQLLKAFFAPLRSLPFDDECAEHYGQIHADLLNQGKPIGPNDTLIAAIARAHDATLITHNTAEFSRVAGLRLEDWEVV
ncbi:MAG TPA: type II toxin-antitoxin system VapC family toxin [Rugosibacter sp.]|nr:type II toxin-antitoxin system VapC family toxin [Rugosibacter sp.]HQN46067.1 type II toxin-antitoxin system VapC family toxin [Rugosibacter sp.]HQQ35910.1 type II toxin-antitoxin system VapC family toxin [Rugosibacter sp.]